MADSPDDGASGSRSSLVVSGRTSPNTAASRRRRCSAVSDADAPEAGVAAGSGGSDTTILLHLSADRERAYGISIPRDSMVNRPACNHGAIPAASYQQWNAAFAIGGPGCTMQQFEQLTGVLIDHYVVVDFNGFQGMVDAIGGVQVCVPEEINDQAHGIHLDAGTYDVSGKQAPVSYTHLTLPTSDLV